ncbi:MAG: GntR family transcriptional regulator, partial [Thermoleophilia bacterium]
MQTTQEFAIQLNDAAGEPLYRQISEQVKQAVAKNRVLPGQRLPTVRQLAQSLGINPGTVARAYLELEQENVVVSRRGGGTMVAARSSDPSVATLRRKHLSDLVGSHILEALSLGHSPEEIEAAFFSQLARWREERVSVEKPAGVGVTDIAADAETLRIVASHDLALNLLVDGLKKKDTQARVELNYAGSLGGLIALQEGRADLAGIHLLDEESGEY